MDIQQLADRLEERLLAPLPGEETHKLMWPSTRHVEPFPHTPEEAIPAAVLILLFSTKGKIRFFLTERTHEVEYHKGQISLPGGIWEEGEQLHETAVRETEEEIGVIAQSIQLIGGLTPFFTPVTGFMVHPFIGWCKAKPQAEPHDKEVKTLFTTSLDRLLDETSFKKEIWNLRGYEAEVPYFQLNGHKVWGVTGAILAELKWILKEIMR